jgi:hypothetical protein
MTSEKKTMLKVFLKALVVMVFAGLYAWSGMEMKWMRRFLAPAILCLSAFGFSRDWRYLVQMPVMFITLCLGYGADSVWLKILKRGIFGLTNGASSSVRNIWAKQWLLAMFQIILVTATFIAFGVFNPLPSARAEEFLLGVVIALIPMVAVKDYEN